MDSRIVEVELGDWSAARAEPRCIEAVEAGKVLYFPGLPFTLQAGEPALLTPELLAPGKRNISLDAQGRLKGATGDAATQAALSRMVMRFRAQAEALVHGLFPHYVPALRMAPTSFRPTQVETREQSWRADDRRLHVDAFPSRPNYGERILRVFTNVNPDGQPRTWRVGESFEEVAARFLPGAKPYSALQARLLRLARVTKSLRSEYDHLMIQLHDAMKSDARYQRESPQQTMPFPPGSVWVCFSDQTSHAVMSGQYMLEQTLHLPADAQYNAAASPLAILSRLTGRKLV